MQGRVQEGIATIVFVLGVLMMLALAALMAWAAFEGLSYFATGADYDQFGGMHCPILISSAETGLVRADLTNPSDEAQQPYYEVEISGRVASRTLENQITVQPHTTQQVTWSVNAGDIDLQPFIFVKMDILPVGGYATREATCGILVAGLAGMSGTTALSIALAASLLCLVLGLILPVVGLSPRQAVQFDTEAASNTRRAAQAMGVAAAAALFSGMMGWWLAALLLLAVSLLLLVMTLPSMIARG